MKQFQLRLLSSLLISICLFACEDDDSVQPTTSSTSNNKQDTSQIIIGSQFWLDNGAVKCTPFTKNFNAVLKQVNVNSEKCYMESVRPNISFYFHKATFGAGTFNMVDNFLLGPNEVNLSISGYNEKSYRGTGGTINVSRNTADTSKWDIEFNNLQLFSSTDSMNHTFTGRIEEI